VALALASRDDPIEAGGAVLQLHPGHEVTAEEIKSFVKARVGSVKTPKQVEVWDDLPRSRVGKVLKTEVKSRLQNPLEPH